jgi:hypothetical protein
MISIWIYYYRNLVQESGAVCPILPPSPMACRQLYDTSSGANEVRNLFLGVLDV